MTTLAPRIGRIDASRVFIRRSLTHSWRDVETLIMSIALPATLMAMFTYVFGGAIDPSGNYVNYVVPGTILLAAGFGAASTAVAVARDMSQGMTDRLRTMSLPHDTVVLGHVVASVVRNLVATTVVVGVALALGFRPTAGPLEWLAAAGLVTLYILAITYVFAAIGIVAGTPEAASGYGFILLFLPYLSSAFVPIDTMPSWLGWFSQHQPITPITETMRALLVGGAGQPWLALGWAVVLSAAGAAWATVAFQRRARRG
jgi:ABC-2 type transport system permease protein